MTARTTRPRCVLLDANVVIKAHELGIWSQLTERYELILPGIVISDEARYFKTTKRHKAIKLQEAVIKGQISQLSATADEFVQLYSVFEGGDRRNLAIAHISFQLLRCISQP